MSIKQATLAVAVLTAVALAACGRDDYSAGTAATDSSPMYSTPTAPVAPTADAGLALTTTKLGTILADANRNTLYLFTKDTPTTSACTGDCASNWPPVLGGATLELGPGLDEADFATINSATSDQLTFHGHPLYYYAGDVHPGDTNGEGIGSNWYVIDADGTPIR